MISNDKTMPHRILVIDDNAAIHDDFRKILTTVNVPDDAMFEMESILFGAEPQPPAPVSFEIDSAFQGEEGLRMIRHARLSGRPYALAFVDGRMPPGWDGIETISHLWQECPDLQVVLCTAYADYSWEEIRRHLGESDSLLILKKPFDNVEALQLAHALTSKWELNRRVQGQLDDLDTMVREKTEEEKRAKALLEAAIEHSPVGIIITDGKYASVLKINPEALRLFGSTQLPLPGNEYKPRGMDWEAFRADGSPYPHEEYPLLRAVGGGEIIKDEEAIIRDGQGRDRWISSSAAPVRNSAGDIVAGILVMRDITERKHADRERERLQAQLNQAQKLESVGLLAGGVAHDFNNMLGVILGQVELGMMAVDPTDVIYDKLETIQKAAQRSAELTRQLMAFSRRQTVMPKVLDLNEVVSGTLTMIKRLIGEDIDLIWRPGSGVWPVKIDPSQIDQTLTNLCINARDAIDGVGSLTIETANVVFDASDCAVNPESMCGDYVMLAVSDDGSGIDPETLDHVFEPFFTTKERGKGTGLGLATVYGIVKQNDGLITVDTGLDNGSTFKIYLPRFMDESEPVEHKSESTPKRGRGETVLIVEDEGDILDMGKIMLETLGYGVLTASTPGEALRLAACCDRKIDLVITDVIMPEMNGRDLVNNLMSQHPSLKSLYMSGYTADVIAHRGVLDEGVHFVQKPFSMNEFAMKIRDALGTD